MRTIRDLLERDLDHAIEEVIKVDQTDERAVHAELTEYVVTERISAEYRELLDAIAEAPARPHEGIGVWVSGFFGSGKSSFAKNLGYVLANRDILGTPAAELFKRQFRDPRVPALVESINARIPTEAIMFDVSVDAAVRKANERMAEIMYRVLLRELDYAEDYQAAELEIELEREGKLAEFSERCRLLFHLEWRLARKGAQKIARASAILHAMDAQTYPAADSWARSIAGREPDLTVARVVQRTFELAARRRPGKALVFIIDEVGQYVARSAEKIEDLRAVVEQFGKESNNRVKARQAPAPVWIIVTSQEKLDEVVAAIDSKQVQLAKLQDRFKYHVDLAPADIREVATRRVLSKKPEAAAALRALFAAHQGLLNAACHIERTTRQSDVREDDFVQFYPYLPHYIDLSIDIVSGIRLQPGAPKHLGGANRTIIKQAYEMLVNERTAMADRPIGTLVTLDRVYELVEGNVGSEKQKDVSDIAQRFQSDPADGGWAARTAKALCLLEYVRDLPRTPANLAAVLVERVDAGQPLAEVEAALERLKTAQFVRETEEGYKLQTAQEKNWQTERRKYLDPSPRERNEIKRDLLAEIFADPRLKTYRFENLRTFRVGLRVDDARAGEEGQIAISLLTADGADELPRKLSEARDGSRQQAHLNDVSWVMAFTTELDRLIANLHASRQMITTYEQARGQNRITNAEAESLAGEKQEESRLRRRLQEKLEAALLAGTGLFRGVAHDGSALGGKTFAEALRKLLDLATPELYPKLKMGARPLKGNEAEEVLKAANLNALPSVFYDGEQGFHLVARDAGKYVPNMAAGVAREVLDYLKREHGYGNKVTGRALEAHFGGFGYGWEPDVLRLVLAVLLRAGAIEVTTQGQRFGSHQNPLCRPPFISPPAFHNASFAPREAIALRTLTTAAAHLEELTGGEVDVEEAALVAAANKLADEETRLLLPLLATARAAHLPAALLDDLADYQSNLELLQRSTADDCVRILAGEGNTLKQARDRVRQMRQALDPAGLETIRRARQAIEAMWPALNGAASGDPASASPDGLLPATVAELRAAVEAPDLAAHLPALASLSDTVATAYRARYDACHQQRNDAYRAAIDVVRNQPQWIEVAADAQPALLAPLQARLCAVDQPEQTGDAPDGRARQAVILPDGEVTCPACHATIAQMDSDLAAMDGLQARALARLGEITAPPTPPGTPGVKRVRLLEFFAGTLDSEAAVDRAISRLREHLLTLVAEGVHIVLE